MDGTILSQGTFTAFVAANPTLGVASNVAGTAMNIPIPSGADWVKVYDYTKASQVGLATVIVNGAATANAGLEWYWQRGMAAGTGIVKYKTTGSSVLNEDTLTAGGFTVYDPTGSTPGSLPTFGPAVAFTGISNATQPVVTTASTAGIQVGSIVRLQLPTGSTALASDVSGIDFVVGAVTLNTSFTLLTAASALANAPGLTTGTGTYRIVNYSAYWYPRTRYISNIAVNAVNANFATVSVTIPHGLTPGQEIRFDIPNVSGMVQLNATGANNYQSYIVQSVIDDYDFVVNANISSFTAFTYPTVAQQPSSFPLFNPVGEDTATSLITPLNQVPTIAGLQIFNTNSGLLADSVVNTAFLGMTFGSGGVGATAGAVPLTGPSGSVAFTAGNVATGDVMYWVAGKSSLGGL
jgi:hypothetical protein